LKTEATALSEIRLIGLDIKAYGCRRPVRSEGPHARGKRNEILRFAQDDRGDKP
jgi:hypothetical protein